ncbi:MAG: AraC family transcriptional regulator [Victivallales bacterium]|jgi:AraC-like DNA-binding protein|nr:AraC family transcriptional regulator [Victivallales bacterium]
MGLNRLNEYVYSDRLHVFVASKASGEHEKCTFHDHEYSEIVLITGGTAMHAIGKLRSPIRTGDVLVLHPGIAHNYLECDAKFKLINIGYDIAALPIMMLDNYKLPFFKIIFRIGMNSYDALKPVMTLNEQELEHISSRTELLHEETIGISPGAQLMTMLLFQEIALTLARYFHGAVLVETTRLQFTRIIAYLNAHYTENVNIDDLAKMSNSSARNFYRLFRVMTGCTPHRYMLRLRLNRAMELLRYSDASLKEIAFTCGFCDVNHFYRRFREYMKISPQSFRKKF